MKAVVHQSKHSGVLFPVLHKTELDGSYLRTSWLLPRIMVIWLESPQVHLPYLTWTLVTGHLQLTAVDAGTESEIENEKAKR